MTIEELQAAAEILENLKETQYKLKSLDEMPCFEVLIGSGSGSFTRLSTEDHEDLIFEVKGLFLTFLRDKVGEIKNQIKEL